MSDAVLFAFVAGAIFAAGLIGLFVFIDAARDYLRMKSPRDTHSPDPTIQWKNK